MKKIFKIFILTTILHACSCYPQTIASITQNIITTDSVSRAPMYVISDAQTYTSGGLTFIYPTGLFTTPPLVQVSIQPTTSHPTTESYVAEISANTAGSTTIMAYQITSGVVTEAPNSSLTIYLLAIADPV